MDEGTEDTRMAEWYVYSSIIHNSREMAATRVSRDERVNKIHVRRNIIRP